MKKIAFFFIGELPSDASLGDAFLGFERIQKDNFIKRFGENTHLTQKISDEYKNSKRRNIINKLDFLNEKTIENGQLPSLLFFPHLRYLENQKGSQINKETSDYELIYRYENIKTFKGSLQSYLIWLDYAESELFEKIIAFLNDLNFDGKTFHIKRKDLAVLVKTKEGHIHQLHELSSGEQNIIIILTELWRHLDRKSCIVLIDEIENSLHPAYQHFFAKALKKLQKIADFQLIVTTHSSEIVTQFGTPSLRILTKF